MVVLGNVAKAYIRFVYEPDADLEPLCIAPSLAVYEMLTIVIKNHDIEVSFVYCKIVVLLTMAG